MRKLINKLFLKLGYVPASDVKYMVVRVKPNIIKIRSEYNVPLSKVAEIKDPKLVEEMIKFEVNQKLFGKLKELIEYETYKEITPEGEEYTVKAKLNIAK